MAYQPKTAEITDEHHLHADLHRSSLEVPVEADFRANKRGKLVEAEMHSKDEAVRHLADLIVTEYLNEKEHEYNNQS